MARTGRKRKPGKRTKSGQLSRAGIPSFDKGTERVQAMRAIYGTSGTDAIGRAYHAGLLGSGSDAKALLDTARTIANAYWATYENGKIGCTLGERTYGSVTDIDEARAKRRQDWLEDVLKYVNGWGHDHRRAFDQLVINPYPDFGPHWLDMLLADSQARRDQLEKALSPLRGLAY